MEVQQQLEKRILEAEKMMQQQQEEKRKAVDAVEKQVSLFTDILQFFKLALLQYVCSFVRNKTAELCSVSHKSREEFITHIRLIGFISLEHSCIFSPHCF